MNTTTLFPGTTIRSKTSSAQGVILRHENGRYAIRFASGTVSSLSEADVAARFMVVQAVKNVTTAPQSAPLVRRSNWRCPNPRDCGDPTCDGSCGY